MDLPKCKICGGNHRLGGCPQTSSRGVAEGLVAPKATARGHGAPVPRETHPVAKATKGKTGTAETNGPVRRSTTGTGLRVGEAVAVQPATSEVMDVTAGETAPRFDRNAYQREYMRKRRAKK